MGWIKDTYNAAKDGVKSVWNNLVGKKSKSEPLPPPYDPPPAYSEIFPVKTPKFEPEPVNDDWISHDYEFTPMNDGVASVPEVPTNDWVYSNYEFTLMNDGVASVAGIPAGGANQGPESSLQMSTFGLVLLITLPSVLIILLIFAWFKRRAARAVRAGARTRSTSTATPAAQPTPITQPAVMMSENFTAPDPSSRKLSTETILPLYEIVDPNPTKILENENK